MLLSVTGHLGPLAECACLPCFHTEHDTNFPKSLSVSCVFCVMTSICGELRTLAPPVPLHRSCPLAVEGLTALLKKHNITRDTDTAFKLFNVLSKHHSVIQPEVFREFYDNWKNHIESIKCFQLPPDLKLETKGHSPEVHANLTSRQGRGG